MLRLCLLLGLFMVAACEHDRPMGDIKSDQQFLRDHIGDSATGF